MRSQGIFKPIFFDSLRENDNFLQRIISWAIYISTAKDEQENVKILIFLY